MSSESRKKPEREATQETDFSGAMVPGFDVSTAAQAASYFAQKAGGKIDMLKLIKLMYLAERKNMEVYDRPMFYDLFFSMEKGPVPSMVYYLIDGEKKDSEWSKHIRSRKKNSNIIECIGQGQFDHLSEADTEILEDVWQQFADLDGTEMAEWTHRHCTEWQNPSRGSQRITHQSIFRTLGKKRASRLAENVENHRLAKAALATGA